jgi:rare lipoprotein A
VRITDRGPFVDGRVIDLSHEAAKLIDMIGPGVMKVRLDLTGYGPAREAGPEVLAQAPRVQPAPVPPRASAPVTPPPPPPPQQPAEPPVEPVPQSTVPATPVTDSFAVQVGLFNDKSRAERLRDRLQPGYGTVALVPREGERTQWRVLVGNKPTEADASALAVELRKKTGDALVVRRDQP